MLGPIFVVAPPRSGGALLAGILASSPGIAAGDDVLDDTIERVCGRDRLTEAEATPPVIAALREAANAHADDARLLVASPLAAVRVRFLHAVFPTATFVYIYREPRRAVWDLRASEAAAEDLAREWSAVTATLLDDLERIPAGSWMVSEYRSLTTEPNDAIGRIAQFLGIEWDGRLPEPPLTAAAPTPDEMRGLDAVDAITRDVASRARDFFARSPERIVPHRGYEGKPAAAGAASFASVSTTSFPALLDRLGITLVVSTYQSGRLIFVRALDAGTLNTHFRMFTSPMGIAVRDGHLAVGTDRAVWDYRNQPAVAQHVEPAGKHDGCFVPRRVHVTGDIRVHEIGWAQDELWIVNTRFSALCTLDGDSSFVPRWSPPFISRLAAEDRCHLNGMAIAGDRVKFVTALGTTDSIGGWREKKATGGVLVDVASGEIVLHGLSMPHSPRLRDGRFYILESGRGTIATADLTTGKIEAIAELPGFTRGLAFAGPLAFVGLSQVRESNIFGGIPLTERVAERECGVYAIDLRTGRIAAFLRFEGDVREIFDVQVLPMRYPELLELNDPLVATSYSVPDECLAAFA